MSPIGYTLDNTVSRVYAAKINYSHVLNTTKLMPKIGFLYFNESIDTFGVIIIFLAYISGILSYMALDTRIF